MSLLLAGKPVSAAVSPRLPVNRLSSARASVENVSRSSGSVDLPVSVRFLGQQLTTVLSFTVVDDEIAFDIILGSDWDTCWSHHGRCTISSALVL